LLVASLGLVAAACGADQGVLSLGAAPTPDDTATAIVPAPDDTTAGTEPDTTGSTQAPPTEVATEPTLPAIIQPELYADIPFGDVVDAGDDKPARDHDPFVAVALTDIQRWWQDVYPEVYGQPFEPLEGGIYAGYPERTDAIPGCGERETAYEDLQLFVAFYCEFGDFMAYDDGDGADSLLTPLADEYGSAVMGVVFAHEYGHAIQARIGALDRVLATIITEQQADCFAGAWTGQAYRGESPLLRLGDRDVRAGLLAMLSVRDPVGTDQFVPGGHGSAFDRVGAFQVGFLEGPGRCAELLDDPLPLMPNQFQQQRDFLRGGDASYDCSDDPDPDCTPAPVFLAEDVNDFWRTTLGADFAPVTAVPVDDIATVSCDGRVALAAEVVICPADRTVVYDEPAVLELYREFGDFSLGYFFGIGWSEFAQRQLASPLTGEDRALLSDCFTGVWVRDITPDQLGNTPRQGDRDGDGVDDTVTSSPGDLDEAIQMAIITGDQGANVDVVGSPFEKIDAFRSGVLGGLSACEALL
jgi:predicted metalloprotease